MQDLSEILFWVNTISGVILALLLGTEDNFEEIHIVPLVTFGLGVPLFSYVECMLLHGFGELIEETQYIYNQIEKTDNKIDNKSDKYIMLLFYEK